MKLFALLTVFVFSVIVASGNITSLPFNKGSASAASSMYLETSKNTVSPGESFTVEVKASSDKAFNTAQIDIEYSILNLTLDKVTVGKALPEVAQDKKTIGSLNYAIYKINGTVGQNLSLMTLTFTGNKNIGKITLKDTSRILEAGEALAYGGSSVEVSVEKPEPKPEPQPKPEPKPEPQPKPEPKPQDDSDAKNEDSQIEPATTNSDNGSGSNTSAPLDTTTDVQTSTKGGAEEIPNSGPGSIVALAAAATSLGYIINILRFRYIKEQI